MTSIQFLGNQIDVINVQQNSNYNGTNVAGEKPASGPSFTETVEPDRMNENESIYLRTGTKPHIMIICNFEDELRGYKKDVERLEQMWKKFDCDVTVKKNINAEKLKTTIFEYAHETLKGKENYIAVFILSHGAENDYILGSDRHKVHVSEILDRFTSNNTKLQNIPKLFFFQVCRGSRPDQGVPNTQTAADQERPAMIPQVCDTLVTYAAQRGTTAFVNETGSWFIESLVDVFKEYAEKEHVADMLTMVNKRMAEKTAQHDSDNQIHGAKAMSEYISTLREKIYLCRN